MFDIGFWELALIGVVALLVVGPDRLPGLARNVGLWVGRIRRYVASVRDDIEREIQAEELKKVLQKPSDLNPLKDVVEETRSVIGSAKNEITHAEKDAEKAISGDAQPADGDSSPADAATTVGKAASAGGKAPDKEPSEAPEAAVEETRSDERQAR